MQTFLSLDALQVVSHPQLASLLLYFNKNLPPLELQKVQRRWCPLLICDQGPDRNNLRGEGLQSSTHGRWEPGGRSLTQCQLTWCQLGSRARGLHVCQPVTRQSPPLVAHLPQSHLQLQPSKPVPPSGEQGFKHASPQGTFWIQTRTVTFRFLEKHSREGKKKSLRIKAFWSLLVLSIFYI